MPGFVCRITFLSCLMVTAASSQEFSIQIASPVASQNSQMKRSAFVFRTVGCSTEAKPEFTAAAEGTVDGARRTVPLRVVTGAAPNVFGIFHDWPLQGHWVVSLKAVCGSRSAGALVATDAKGIVRESSTVLNHFATEADIVTSLKASRQK
ncbi:MAG: hypothetical protein H7Y20_03175 [Bryobacteraceae bacterium]|nr:hypothetical protein [Bryobacteraceae bacterium]